MGFYSRKIPSFSSDKSLVYCWKTLHSKKIVARFEIVPKYLQKIVPVFRAFLLSSHFLFQSFLVFLAFHSFFVLNFAKFGAVEKIEKL